jgi:hypothetical protein
MAEWLQGVSSRFCCEATRCSTAPRAHPLVSVSKIPRWVHALRVANSDRTADQQNSNHDYDSAYG